MIALNWKQSQLWNMLQDPFEVVDCSGDFKMFLWWFWTFFVRSRMNSNLSMLHLCVHASQQFVTKCYQVVLTVNELTVVIVANGDSVANFVFEGHVPH